MAKETCRGLCEGLPRVWNGDDGYVRLTDNGLPGRALVFLDQDCSCAGLDCLANILMTVGLEAAFQALWPGRGPMPGPSLTATPAAELAYMIAIILAADLGFFIGHYLTHKVPLLWEFHKVHHSAPVLNPLTNYRFHPLDRIPLGLFMGLLTALVKGGFAFAYPGGIAEMTAVNVGVLLLFNLSANLRHSHIWLSYGWHLSHVLSSPAQHQIHHGSESRHIDKNFGLMFSVWDWIAGTLYVPRAREEVRFGLSGREHEEYDSLWRLYSLPFVKAAAVLRGRPAPGARPEGARRLEGQEG